MTPDKSRRTQPKVDSNAVAGVTRIETLPPPNEAAARSALQHCGPNQLLRVCELSELIAEFALLGRADQVATTAEILQMALFEAKPQVRLFACARVNARMREVLVATRRGDLNRVALAAAELYRLAHREIPVHARTMPLQVFLLNYAGLKLAALSKKAPCDCAAIEAATFEATAYWARFDPSIRDSRLNDLFEGVAEMLVDATSKQEPQRIGLAARRLHVISHLLEAHIETFALDVDGPRRLDSES